MPPSDGLDTPVGLPDAKPLPTLSTPAHTHTASHWVRGPPGETLNVCQASVLVSEWSYLSVPVAGGIPPLGCAAGRVVTPASLVNPLVRGGARRRRCVPSAATRYTSRSPQSYRASTTPSWRTPACPVESSRGTYRGVAGVAGNARGVAGSADAGPGASASPASASRSCAACSSRRSLDVSVARSANCSAN